MDKEQIIAFCKNVLVIILFIMLIWFIADCVKQDKQHQDSLNKMSEQELCITEYSDFYSKNIPAKCIKYFK